MEAQSGDVQLSTHFLVTFGNLAGSLFSGEISNSQLDLRHYLLGFVAAVLVHCEIASFTRILQDLIFNF